MHILFAILRQLRQARKAEAMLEGGASTQQIASALRVPPFIAKQIAGTGRARATRRQLERALEELAELDYACAARPTATPARRSP